MSIGDGPRSFQLVPVKLSVCIQLGDVNLKIKSKKANSNYLKLYSMSFSYGRSHSATFVFIYFTFVQLIFRYAHNKI